MFNDKRIDLLTRQLADANAKIEELTSSLMNLVTSVAKRDAEIKKLKKDVEAMKDDIFENAKRTDELEAGFERFKIEFDEVVSNTMELNEEERKTAEALMKSLNFNPFNFEENK